MTHDKRIYEFAEGAADDLNISTQKDRDKCVDLIADALQSAFDDVTLTASCE